MHTGRSTDHIRLRLAAALAHQVRHVAVTLWPADGPTVVVARLQRHHPDLSACTFRGMVRSGWSMPLDDLTVDGIGVRHVGDGVVAVDHGDAQGRWWPTLLDASQLTTVLADAAAGALEAELVAPAVVATAEVAAHVDTELGVTLVQLRTQPGSVSHDRRCDGLARALARACVISELCEGVGSGSRR